MNWMLFAKDEENIDEAELNEVVRSMDAVIIERPTPHLVRLSCPDGNGEKVKALAPHWSFVQDWSLPDQMLLRKKKS